MFGVLRRRPARAGLIAALALLGGLGLFGGHLVALGGFSGKVGGSATFSTSTQLLSDTVGSNGACLSAANSSASIASDVNTCGSYPLSSTAGGSQTVALAATGSLAPTAATGATAGACGVQEAADTTDFSDISSTATNTAIPQGGVQAGVAGPSAFTDSPTAVSFDGSSGYLETTNSYASPGPETFSLSMWFQTSTGGVPLMGFSNAQLATGQSNYDRMLWLDGSGHLVFGVYGSGSTVTFSSAAASATNYANGAWHQVVVTVAAGSPSTILIYADGSLVAGSPGDFNGSAPGQSYAGWWHIGEATTSSAWTPKTLTNFFRGSMADVATFSSALSASQVSALASQTTQSAESSTTLGDSPLSYWPLQQTGPDPLVAVGGVTLGSGTGPLGSPSTAAAFTGSSSGYLESLTQTTAPQTFSLSLWFKTSTKGTSLVQYSSGQAQGSGTGDRALWLDSSGHLVFYLNPGSAYELSSASGNSTSYADGAWHHVVVTAAPASSTTGTVLMYIDGSLVAGSSGDETISNSDVGATANGWWQLGTTQGASQSSPPTSAYLTGSLADVAVFPTVLSASQVSTLKGETTQAAYAQQALADAPTSFWGLQDTGADLYTGTIADVGSATPCSYLAVTVASGGNCLYPAGSGSCPSSPTTWLSSAPSFTIPSSLGTLTLTTSVSGSLPAAAQNLHVSVPWAFTTTGGGFTAEVLHPTGYVLL